MKRRFLRKTRRPDGFTLLEILVVLAILGLGLAAITTLTTATSRQAEQVEEETAVQNACQNIMNSILAGDATVSIGLEIPIPDAPNWTARVETLDGPIPSVVAIRITAQRYETIETPSAANPYASVVSWEPEPGRSFVFKEWARRADVRTRTLRRNLDGTVSAVNGTAETLLQDDVATQQNAQSATTPFLAEPGQKLQGSFYSSESPAASFNAPSSFSSVDSANGLSSGFPSGAAPTY